MKSTFLRFLAVVLGAAVHHYLFWQSGLGINTLVFAVLTLTSVFAFHPDLRRSPAVMALAAGTVVAAGAVVISHSIWSQWMYLLSFTLLIGVVQQREVRFLFYAFWLGVLSWLVVPWRKLTLWSAGTRKHGKWSALQRWSKLLVLPLFVFALFLTVYSEANTHLAGLLEHIGHSFEWLTRLQWKPWSLLFFLFGMGILSSLLYPSTWGSFFSRFEAQSRVWLQRRRLGRQWAIFRSHSTLALRNEYWMGILVIGMLNGLLLFVNVLDFRYVWWPPADPSPQELSQFVHKGTSMLILAILMAMGVLLVFFRHNLNFLRDNQLLKQLAYLWILQNGVLALSVAVRNLHYVQHYGLTHNRLGVFVFLLLAIIGLVTLYAKIRFVRTIYYLFLINAWFWYAVFLGYGTVNWNVLITRYNITHPPVSGIDEHYLTQLGDDNTFLLLQHRDELPAIKGGLTYYSLEERVLHLERKLERKDWRSWNLTDERNRRYLAGIGK